MRRIITIIALTIATLLVFVSPAAASVVNIR